MEPFLHLPVATEQRSSASVTAQHWSDTRTDASPREGIYHIRTGIYIADHSNPEEWDRDCAGKKGARGVERNDLHDLIRVSLLNQHTEPIHGKELVCTSPKRESGPQFPHASCKNDNGRPTRPLVKLRPQTHRRAPNRTNRGRATSETHRLPATP